MQRLGDCLTSLALIGEVRKKKNASGDHQCHSHFQRQQCRWSGPGQRGEGPWLPGCAVLAAKGLGPIAIIAIHDLLKLLPRRS